MRDACRRGFSSHNIVTRLCLALLPLYRHPLMAPATAEGYPDLPSKSSFRSPPAERQMPCQDLSRDWLSRKWGQPVVIENRTGAAGNIGAEAGVSVGSDGYTLFSAPPPPLVINQNLYPKLAV